MFLCVQGFVAIGGRLILIWVYDVLLVKFRYCLSVFMQEYRNKATC